MNRKREGNWAPGGSARGDLRPADPWFAVEWQADGIIRIWEPHVSRLLRANMFLIRGRDRDLLVDAGMGVASLRGFLAPMLDKPVTLLVTHAHVDHIGSAAEFAGDIIMHPLEAPLLAQQNDWSLSFETASPERKAGLQAAGFDTEGALIAALPHADFDVAGWSIPSATVTETADEGTTIDLGGRSLSVLHLPGHSPGSIGLFEEATGILIGGDAIYDGLIIDTLPDSDPVIYRNTMQRLRDLDVRLIHGGHRESFGPKKLHEIIDGYLNGSTGGTS